MRRPHAKAAQSSVDLNEVCLTWNRNATEAGSEHISFEAGRRKKFFARTKMLFLIMAHQLMMASMAYEVAPRAEAADIIEMHVEAAKSLAASRKSVPLRRTRRVLQTTVGCPVDPTSVSVAIVQSCIDLRTDVVDIGADLEVHDTLIVPAESAITIQGTAGQTLKGVDGQPTFLIFGPATVIVKTLKFVGGQAFFVGGRGATLVMESLIFESMAADFGAVVHANGVQDDDRGNFTLLATDITVTDTSATTGGAFYVAGEIDLPSTVTLIASSFSRVVAENGGVLEAFETDITFDGCSFRDTTATSEIGGGGVLRHVTGNVCTIQNCTFLNNSADLGGAVLTLGPSLIIDSSTFENNAAFVFGGSIDARYSNVWVSNSSFLNGYATRGAGAIFAIRTNLTIETSKFTNLSSTDGGAIYLSEDNRGTGDDAMKLTKSTFSGNRAEFGADFISFSTAVIVDSSIFEDGDASITGGSMYIDYAIPVEITDCIFNRTEALFAGAFLAINSKSVMKKCIIDQSVAMQGIVYGIGRENDEIQYIDSKIMRSKTQNAGGIFMDSFLHLGGKGFALLQNSTFEDNVAEFRAGALAIATGGPLDVTIRDCVFRGNSAGQTGGAMEIANFFDYHSLGGDVHTLIIENTIVTDNWSGGNGGVGAIYPEEGLMIIERGTVISNNSAATRGGAFETGVDMYFACVDIFDNYANGTESDVYAFKPGLALSGATFSEVNIDRTYPITSTLDLCDPSETLAPFSAPTAAPTGTPMPTPKPTFFPTPVPKPTPLPAPTVSLWPTFIPGDETITTASDAEIRFTHRYENFGDSPSMRIDGDDGGGPTQGLLKFDLTNVSSTVSKAILRVHTLNPTNGYISAFKMLTPWEEANVTWAQFGDLGIEVDDLDPSFSFNGTVFLTTESADVTKDVNSWLSGSSPNHGWVFANPSMDGWDFATSEAPSDQPSLTLVY